MEHYGGHQIDSILVEAEVDPFHVDPRGPRVPSKGAKDLWHRMGHRDRPDVVLACRRKQSAKPHFGLGPSVGLAGQCGQKDLHVSPKDGRVYHADRDRGLVVGG